MKKHLFCYTLFACAAETACTAFGLGQLLALLELHGEIGHHHKLCDAVAVGDDALVIAVIVEGDDILAAVVAVAYAHAVGGTETLLGGKAAAGEDGAEIAFGDGEGEASADFCGGVRGYGDITLGQAGIEVIACGTGGTGCGYPCLGAEFFCVSFALALKAPLCKGSCHAKHD